MLEAQTYEERCWHAEGKVDRLKKLLLSCKEAMIISNGTHSKSNWIPMIKAIDDELDV